MLITTHYTESIVKLIHKWIPNPKVFSWNKAPSGKWRVKSRAFHNECTSKNANAS